MYSVVILWGCLPDAESNYFWSVSVCYASQWLKVWQLCITLRICPVTSLWTWSVLNNSSIQKENTVISVTDYVDIDYDDIDSHESSTISEHFYDCKQQSFWFDSLNTWYSQRQLW